MLGLLARKKGMTQIFDGNGNVVPVTVLEAGPCTVTEVKTVKKCGYNAIQIGFQKVEDKKVTKPMKGKFAKVGLSPFSTLREFKTDKAADFTVGNLIDLNVFNEGDTIKVQGITKGRGFQGVMKRHGKHGGPAGHGSRFHRAPGSIGQNSSPSRVWKNMKLPGHYGCDNVKIRNLSVVDIDKENNLLLVKGSVPGARNGLVIIENCAQDFEDRVVSFLNSKKEATENTAPTTEATEEVKTPEENKVNA